MNELDAWNSFLHSGSIYDYLIYKSIHNDRTENIFPENDKDEIYYKRTYNQGTEYKGEG
jgi:hypothetical protein